MVTGKRISSLILLVSIAISHCAFANPVENYDSGKVRITKIVSNPETGIAAYNKKNINYAEIQNITEDLNIPQIAKYFGCKTIIGQSFIEETLQCPVASQDKNTVLARRQNAIKALVENPELKKEVEELLTAAQENEQEIIKLMSEFFIGKTCYELANIESIKQQNPFFYPMLKFLVLNKTARTVSTAINLISLAGTVALAGVLGGMTYKLSRKGHDCLMPALYTTYTSLLGALEFYGVYQDYSTASEKRTKMHSLNQLINIAEKLEDLCRTYRIQNQFNMSAIKNPNGVELIEGLKHPRYQNKKSNLFLTPAVHTFLYKVYEQEKHLAEMFACIAEIDAYNAIATKIIESRNQQNKFCFVTFVENKKPVIKATSFWNVLVSNAISNSIDENKHIILTGPNAGGKTTAIRALLQNIVLGQSFGIAAAQNFEITMFDVIHSYLNISDDLINGASLFVSEVKRAQGILQKIKSLESDKKFFFALDELFTGTAAEDGEVCAYEFVKRISEFDNILFIYATHFSKVKELGTDNAFCANYKVDAPIKNNNGKLVYPYTLSQGANESRVALDIAREASLFA